MRRTNPYLNFLGTTLQAFEFYRSVFGGEFTGLVRFRDFDENTMDLAPEELDLIAHIALPIGDNLLMGTDVTSAQAHGFAVGTNHFIYLEAEAADEARRVFEALGDGGVVVMPLGPSPWAELYGIVVDSFGVQWMVDYTGDVEFRVGHPPA